jgi:predicted RNase H-like nuclease (RuvC/YqgF family)
MIDNEKYVLSDLSVDQCIRSYDPERARSNSLMIETKKNVSPSAKSTPIKTPKATTPMTPIIIEEKTGKAWSEVVDDIKKTENKKSKVEDLKKKLEEFEHFKSEHKKKLEELEHLNSEHKKKLEELEITNNELKLKNEEQFQQLTGIYFQNAELTQSNKHLAELNKVYLDTIALYKKIDSEKDERIASLQKIMNEKKN